RVDTDAFDRLLAELRTQFPLLHERLELTRVGSHGLAFPWPRATRPRAPGVEPRGAVPLARREQRPARGADGAPRRRARRRVGALAAPGLLRRDRRRRDLGSGNPRRQGLRRRDLRGGRATPRGRPPTRAGRLALVRLR